MRSDSLGCNQHPNTNQIPGVCSSCLRDKLLQLHLQSHHHHNHKSNSSIVSDDSSPPVVYRGRGRGRHRRNASEVMMVEYSGASSSSSVVGFDYYYGMNKSRSIAFASSSSRNGVNSGSWRRKKDGFWSKLLKLTRKGTVMHSGIIREGQRGGSAAVLLLDCLLPPSSKETLAEVMLFSSGFILEACPLWSFIAEYLLLIASLFDLLVSSFNVLDRLPFICSSLTLGFAFISAPFLS
ncbi:putative Avr9/Cf-9 rapidly elicited protein [Senna tora]|uniref:Putative Avr9/Cf-9 rapidly elicited protein n=1 Tax=Senna tora TaxID=362788 RepID=A0A834WXQ3_9FABA|nr:putative Avr9/Cf-9 rapidly elicited protein [Senna tora]